MPDLPAHLSGMVTQFKGDGRKLGYPTANLTTDTELKDGVYFGFADLQDWQLQPALIFVGTPTTMGESQRRVEAYLLDIPDKDYYGQELALEIRHFHRSNQRFDTVEQLITAIKADESAGRQWFSSGSARP